jgi:hypothetical protein
MKSIRWDVKRRHFVFDDGTSPSRSDAFAVETALEVSLSSVRRALGRQEGISVPPLNSLPSPERYEHYSEFAESVLAGPDAEIVFESDATDPNMLFFHLTPQGHIRAHFVVERSRVTDEGMAIEITKRVFGKVCELIQLLIYSDDPDDGPRWSFEMICNPAGQTVGSVWQAYQTLYFTLTTMPEDLAKSSEGVQLALQLGRPDSLIGAPESSWLEVKSQDYFLSSAAERIKLAQDVARFANAEGGLLVLGLRTSQSNGVDVISRVTPLPMPARSVARYRGIIDTHVYPFVRALDVFSVPCGNGELIVISIPSQSEDDKPFVVHGNLGSIMDNKVKGQFVSIVQRRGDGAEYLSGPAIHGLLAIRKRRSNSPRREASHRERRSRQSGR